MTTKFFPAMPALNYYFVVCQLSIAHCIYDIFPYFLSQIGVALSYLGYAYIYHIIKEYMMHWSLHIPHYALLRSVIKNIFIIVLKKRMHRGGSRVCGGILGAEVPPSLLDFT